MLFAHLADCHIGAWRDPKMKALPIAAFERAINLIIDRNTDFVIIAGDLFNTAIPPLDLVKRVVTQLQKLKRAAIPVYAIAGSHDYSPSGKTMLDVLEEAGLLNNVCKGVAGEHGLKLRFTTDEKTGVKLTGILGRANSLDKAYYHDLDRQALEAEPGEKIFLFHASITELKPKSLAEMASSPASMLPRGFTYYAGGHVHLTNETSIEGYRALIYPGPLFPASFSELESLGHGSFVFVKDWTIERVPIILKKRLLFTIQGETVAAVNEELERITEAPVEGKIVLLRISGELREGRIADIHFKETLAKLYEKGAYVVMKNTAKLTSKEFAEYSVKHEKTEAVEERIITEHLGQVPLGLDREAEQKLTKHLLTILGEEQAEGEKKYEYEERIVKAARSLLEGTESSNESALPTASNGASSAERESRL